MSSMDFGEKIHPTDRIREVLNSYPFSTTIIRELLANSDDAQATEQSIVLDLTNHPNARICDPRIAGTQGPALLAYNNSIFKKEDWDAIQFIGHSSKAKSTSKIGKFGLGIRSCYHVTDYLQILSGEDLLIFDPLRSFTEHGGIRLTFNRENIEDTRDHFTAFKHFLPDGWNGERFDGTIVRLPLRMRPGLREKIVSPNDIEDLFGSFITNDLNICLLFVNHLRSIEFHIVDEQGSASRTAQCTVALEQSGFDKKVVRLERNGVGSKEEWLMIHERYPAEEVLETLASRVGTSSLAKVLEGSKLCPHVSIAFPLHLEGQPGNQQIAGQLFTFLPLPVKTGFPAHVHALFALDSSRQHLCMNRDKGTMQGSENQIYDEWNRVLFRTVIPHAWSRLLGVVAESQVGAPFAAWPNPHSFAKDGESAFWSSFTQDVLDIALAEQPELAVWPAIGGGCLPLGAVFIFSDDVNVEVAQALAEIGLCVCGPVPGYLFNALAKSPQWKHRILTPENASINLRVEHLDGLRQAQNGRRRDLELILEYLLSTGGIDNIINLPIVPTVSGQFVALSASTTAGSFTLLERTESDLFNACDSHAICIDDLPASVRIQFTESAPTYLNVKLLDAACIVDYLALHPTRQGVNLSSTQLDDAATHFLIQFWTWLGSTGRRHAASLLPQLKSIKLLPLVGGGLQEADRDMPVFDSAEIEGNPALLSSLLALGVPLLSARSTNFQFKSTLRKYGLLKSPSAIKDLLYCLGCSEAAGGVSLSSDQARQLLAHFNTHMPTERLSSYDEMDMRTFRKLPIFPIVELMKGNNQLNVHRRLFAIEGLTVYGAEKGYFDMLPDLPNVVFVDASLVDRRILCLLNNQNQRPLTEIRILEITIERSALRTQPRMILAAILDRVAQRQMDLTGTLREKLRSAAFVVSEAGTMEEPRRLIDPSSPLRPLYNNDGNRLPRMDDDADERVVGSLSSLGLLDRSLSEENVEDRIRYIATNAHFDFSTQLLNILFNFGFPCNSLHIDHSLAWLPTQKGTLANGGACRPGWGQGTVHDSRLFDKVLERISSRVPTVPPSLRARLGWDRPIPVDVLIRQLDLVLGGNDNDIVSRVEVVLQELSRRTLSGAEWNGLRAILSGKAWVPVSAASGDMLVKVWQAVFSLEVFDGVYRIKASLHSSESERRFLRELGCLDEPSFATVKQRLEELEALQRLQPSADVVSSVLEALRFCFTRMTLEGEQLDQLLVPDQRGCLHPRRVVVFNDVGANSLLIPLPAEHCIANDRINSSLAESLGLDFLGLKYIDLNTLGEEMGASSEDLVRESLADYQVHQFLPEFLANADDAGARTFEVILSDGGSSEGLRFLSTTVEQLCTGPSVMICNDKLFTDADFNGICRTRTGGKAQNENSIGQFGLGALTMFHITECAFIFSGTKMLVLDPSKYHLPLVPKRVSCLLGIDQVMDLYPGHFNCLRGLSYYDQDARRVNGTIFFLPLRTAYQAAGRRALSSNVFEDATRSFKVAALAEFERKAPETLLFIENVEDIRVSESRSRDQSFQRLWSITAQRSNQAHEDFVECRVAITSTLGRSQDAPMDWLLVTQKLKLSSIPNELHSSKVRKSVRLGLAALLHAPERVSSRFQPKFYSMLPLPIDHALPVHINASFILSSDRRNIRSDAYDNDASRFNHWILEEKIPQLYLALLERLGQLDGGQDNARWWPEAHLKSTGDQRAHVARGAAGDLSSRLTHKFYIKHLPASERRVFMSIFSHRPLTFQEAVVQPSEKQTPSAVIRSYRLLRPDSLVKVSSACRKRAEEAGVAIAGPEFLRQILLDSGGLQVIRQELSGREVCELLSYISSSSVTLLHGLALLRLEDLSWTTFGPDIDVSARYFLFQEREHNDAPVFPPSRFVSPGFIYPALLDPGRRQAPTSLNVAFLNASGIRSLVQERLETVGNGAKGEWVNAFWKRYSLLPQDGLPEAIKDLPLIPTSSSFRSLQEFQEGKVLLLKHGETAAAEFYRDLGLTVLSSHGLPAGLRNLLHYGEYAPKDRTLSRVLRCIMPRIDTAVRTIHGWPLERQAQFSEHIQSMLAVGELPTELRATARRLPLWLAQRGDEIKYCSAEDTSLLPIGLPVAVGRFCDSFMTENVNIAKMGERHLNLTQLHSRLRPPARLEGGEEERVYYALVSQLVTLQQIRGGRLRLSVPRADRMMVSPDDLYERGDFFVAAFGSSSSRFLLPLFDGLAAHLPVTRNAEISMDLFVRCTLAFQAEDDDREVSRVRRAAVLYGVYSERLPLQIPEGRSRQWQLADGIRFIPRNSNETARECMGMRVELPATLMGLPHIVAPQKVVLKKYHAIAWTQRVTMANEPQVGSRLLLAYQNFGCPAGREVIAHLRALAADYPRGPVVQHDLKETYKWLNDHADSLKSEIMAVRDQAIFLNVDDMSDGDWNWCSATELALETHDVAGFQPVRRFLRQFRALIKAADILEAKYPKFAKENQATVEHREKQSLRAMRDAFNEMRRTGQRTDVYLIPSDSELTDRNALRAHRVFLMACNPWFKAMFNEGFREERQETDNATIGQSTQVSLEALLEFYYTGALHFHNNPDLADLQDTLSLAHYIQDDAFLLCVQREIIDRQIVDPLTVHDVLIQAETLNASLLKQWCQDYVAQNPVYIRRLTEEGRLDLDALN